MKTNFFDSMDKVVKIKLQAMDIVIERMITSLEYKGNPEKLINKTYETWTPDDFTRLATIYGGLQPNPLSNFIFAKEYNKTRKLEAAEVA